MISCDCFLRFSLPLSLSLIRNDYAHGSAKVLKGRGQPTGGTQVMCLCVQEQKGIRGLCVCVSEREDMDVCASPHMYS